jgi:hypothetical protein
VLEPGVVEPLPLKSILAFHACLWSKETWFVLGDTSESKRVLYSSVQCYW